jgi:protein CpxP
MTVRDTFAWPRILLVGAVLASPLIAFAAPPPAGSSDDGHGAPREIDCHARRGPMPGPGFGGFPGGVRAWDAPPPYLAGLTLTEEQQDKVFGILYAAAPAIREQAKALRKAREALEELTTTAQYQETRAKALAEASAKADSQLALLRARTERDIYLLLTPEQRVQMLDRRRERPAHGPGPLPAP